MITVNGVVFKKIDESHVEWLKENYHLRITDIEKHLGMCDETIYKLLKALKIDRPRKWKEHMPNTPETREDLLNPYLSHVKLAEKYGVTEGCIAYRRKKLGVTVRRHMMPTRLEEFIESVLVELDYAYVPQKRIDQWSLDFYLGFKTCIDIHGEWAHTRKGVPERDARKREYLESHGYRYLVIHESEIESAEEKIQQFMTGFPYR